MQKSDNFYLKLINLQNLLLKIIKELLVLNELFLNGYTQKRGKFSDIKENSATPPRKNIITGS